MLIIIQLKQCSFAPTIKVLLTSFLFTQYKYGAEFKHLRRIFYNSFHNVKPKIKAPPTNCKSVNGSPRIKTEMQTATKGSI